MERENNSRAPTFRAALIVYIFGAAITVAYNGGRRRRHPRQPRTNQNADIPVRPPAPQVQFIDFFAAESDISRNSAAQNADIPVGPPLAPPEAVQLIDFFADESDNISTNSTAHSPSDGGGRTSSNPVGLANVTGGFPFRFETGPPPSRDFLRIGDGIPRRHRQSVVPPPPPFDADNLRAQVATLLLQIMATRQEALGRQAEPGVVNALAELIESMVQALEAAQRCAICRGSE